MGSTRAKPKTPGAGNPPAEEWADADGDQAYTEEAPDFGAWVDFDAEPVFRGTYVGTHPGQFTDEQGNPRPIHDFVSVDGEPFSIPGHTVLTRKLAGLEGKRVRIERTGELPSAVKGRQPAKTYSVRYQR